MYIQYAYAVHVERAQASTEPRLFIPRRLALSASSLSVKRRNMSKRSSSATSKTDWSRVRAMADRDIPLSPRHPEASLKHIVRGIARRGLKPVPPKTSISLRLDADVLDWLKSQGPGYQTRINAILRAFKDASAASDLTVNRTRRHAA